MKYKVYIVGHNQYNEYANWLPDSEITINFNKADVVLFAGGEDVHPSMYNEPIHPYSGNNLKRDLHEKTIFDNAIKQNKYILGICRGSQFICVMSGGRLVQHQQNPSYKHYIDTYDNNKIRVTSTHHQAQYPYNLPKEDYKILGWTKDISIFHEDGNRQEMNPELECEIVYYPKTKCLGIQSHPEFVNTSLDPLDVEYINYVKQLFNKFVNNEL